MQAATPSGLVRWCGIAALCGLVAVPPAAWAEGPPHADAAYAYVKDGRLVTLVAVADQRLEQMRGGFEIDGGLKLSFGIERVTYINGLLVSSQTVNVANLQGASGVQMTEALARASGMGLIQNGEGNSFTLNTNVNLSGNVIQNSADNQNILTRTVINSTVNSLQLLRSMNIRAAVQDGIVGALRR